MNAPDSVKQGGNSSGESFDQSFPATLFSFSMFLSFAILGNCMQKVFSMGHEQIVPFHLLSCQGTRIDRCFIIFELFFNLKAKNELIVNLIPQRYILF